MKKLIPLIAVALAMVLPSIMSAEEVEWDFMVETPPLEIIEQNILDGDIPFISTEARTDFLNGIQEVYNARDAENYDLCATLANDLTTTTAVQTITDTIVGNNVSVVCMAVADEYDEWPENILFPAIDSEDIGNIDDGTSSGCLLSIHIEIIPVHFPGCLERRRGHVGDCRIRRHWIIYF